MYQGFHSPYCPILCHLKILPLLGCVHISEIYQEGDIELLNLYSVLPSIIFLTQVPCSFQNDSCEIYVETRIVMPILCQEFLFASVDITLFFNTNFWCDLSLLF